jgi:hypothetical protein
MCTIKDFEYYSNINKIPLLMDVYEGEFMIDIYYFKKDEGMIREDFYNMLPITLQINHYVIADKKIEYSQQALLEWKSIF